MPTPLKKPTLKGLPGKTMLTSEMRRKLNLNETILTINAKHWPEETALVDDYFETHQLNFQALPRYVYDDILSVFNKVISYDEPEGSKCLIPQLLHEYCTRVHSYLCQKHIYTSFERYYTIKEIDARKTLEEIYKEKEEEVTEETVERRALVRVGKRVKRDIDADKENMEPAHIKMAKTSKSFTIHHPQSSTTTPNTPRLQKGDYDVLSRIADIKYRSTTQKATSDIEIIFDNARKEERSNASLKRMPGAIDFLNNTLLDDANFLNVKCLWDVEDAPSFTKALQYILADYYQNCLVQTPYDFQDERTFFCEVIIPMLKTFAIHNKNISFKWCEKESKENKSSWLQSSDYRPKNIETRFLDGYGISDDRGIAVMIESSGAESNVTHSVEDSIKQIKNATDFLTYLKARFQNSSAYTFTKLRTPTMHVIHNQLTMTTTSLGWNGNWQVVDVRTATVPTTKEGRYDLIKVLELLAHLKEIWDEQQEIVLELGAEAAGVGEEFGETVNDHFVFQDT